MARTKSRFVCQECGYVASSWLGRCPECGGWNTLVEEAEVTAKASKSYLPANNEKLRPRTIASVAQTKVERLATGIREFDRVLGGGVVQGCWEARRASANLRFCWTQACASGSRESKCCMSAARNRRSRLQCVLSAWAERRPMITC